MGIPQKMQLRRRYLPAITRDYCTWQANQKGESDYGQVRYRGDRSSARRLDRDVADARPGQPQVPGSPQGNASGLENNIEQVLLPLITAMLKDMQERAKVTVKTFNRHGIREKKGA